MKVGKTISKKLKIMLDKLPGLWYINHRPGNYNYEEDKL